MSDTAPLFRHRRHRRAIGASALTGETVQKRSPIEQAIAESSDRRVRYEKSMREQGFKKTSLWLPIDCEANIRQLIKLLGSTNGKYRDGLALLIDANFSRGGGE